MSVSNYKTLIFKVAFLTFVNPASIWQYLVSSSLLLPPWAESCETKDESVFCILIVSTSLSIFWGDPLKSHCSMAYPEVPSFLKGFITSHIKINNYISQIISCCLSKSKTAATLPLAILCTLQGCLISIILREWQRLRMWNTHSDEFCKIIRWVSWFHEGFITCSKSSVMSLQVGLMQQMKCFIYPWDIFHMPVIKTGATFGRRDPFKKLSDRTNLLSLTFSACQSNFFTTSGASRWQCTLTGVAPLMLHPH